jgi:hypothetical protein
MPWKCRGNAVEMPWIIFVFSDDGYSLPTKRVRTKLTGWIEFDGVQNINRILFRVAEEYSHSSLEFAPTREEIKNKQVNMA